MRQAILVCAFGVACAACWSLLTDVPDLAANGSPTDDGSTDAGGLDSSVPADGASNDAPSEASGDASLGAFCSSVMPAPFFCDDFDVGTLGERWSATEMTGGMLTLDAGTLVAKSVCTSLPMIQLEHVVAKATSLASLKFSMRATNVTTASFRIAGLYVRPLANTNYRVDLFWDVDHLALFEDRDGSVFKGPGLANFDITKTRQIELVINLTTNAATLFVDGARHIAKGLAAPTTMTDFARVDLGIWANQCSAALEMVYDDFVYERQDK